MGFNQRILHVFKRNKSFTYAELDPSHVSSDNEYQDEDRLLNRLSVGDDSFEHAEKGETNCCHRHHSFVRCLGWLNGLFFCLSLYLFTAAMLNWKQVPGGRERNWALKQVSEKCKIQEFSSTEDVSHKKTHSSTSRRNRDSAFNLATQRHISRARGRIHLSKTPISRSRCSMGSYRDAKSHSPIPTRSCQPRKRSRYVRQISRIFWFRP